MTKRELAILDARRNSLATLVGSNILDLRGNDVFLLRGLGKGSYRLTDSFTGAPLGTASAASNTINASFECFLVIEATPAGDAA